MWRKLVDQNQRAQKDIATSRCISRPTLNRKCRIIYGSAGKGCTGKRKSVLPSAKARFYCSLVNRSQMMMFSQMDKKI